MKRTKSMKDNKKGKTDNRNNQRRRATTHKQANTRNRHDKPEPEIPIIAVCNNEAISKGYKGLVSNCPVALAIRDALKREVRVSPSGVQVTDTIRLNITDRLKSILCKYDATGEMEPFIMEIFLRGNLVKVH